MPLEKAKAGATEWADAIYDLKRGDVIELNWSLGAVGRELTKARKCIILSELPAAKVGTGLLIIAPLSTHQGTAETDGCRAYEVQIDADASQRAGLDGKVSCAIPRMVRTISPERISVIYGAVDPDIVDEVAYQLATDVGCEWDE